MSEDINTLATRANRTLQAPGFIHCEVYSEPQRQLAYYFDNRLDSHAFQQGRATAGMNATIPDGNQLIVIVTQP